MTPVEITYYDILSSFCALGISEVEGMNRLQDQGIVSDNCVWASDIAKDDISKVLDFLRKVPQKP